MKKEYLDTLSLEELENLAKIKLFGLLWNKKQFQKKPITAESLIKELKGEY